MTNDSSPKLDEAQIKAFHAEEEKIRAGIAEITLAWGALETAFVMLLKAILKHENSDIASSIYFAPAGIEVRTKIVDAAFTELFSRSALQAEIFPLWSSLLNTLNGLRKTRNKVAHGAITRFHAPNGKSHVRLTEPMPKGIRPIMEAKAKRQKAGLGANDILQSARAVHHARSRIFAFADCVMQFHVGDTSTLLRTLGELKAENQNPPNPNTQTPQEP
jgi:hypothetical protein